MVTRRKAAREAGSDEPSAKGLVFGLAAPVALWMMLWGLTLVSDNTRVASELAASQQDEAVMVCHDGVIAYEKQGLYERLFGTGYFLCTEWRVRNPLGMPGSGGRLKS